jgi:hypothetical protein
MVTDTKNKHNNLVKKLRIFHLEQSKIEPHEICDERITFNYVVSSL